MEGVTARCSEKGVGPVVQSTLPWMTSELACGVTLHEVGAAWVTDQKEEITWQVWETVSSLWSVGGVKGFEVGIILNENALLALLRRFPPLCGARGGK